MKKESSPIQKLKELFQNSYKSSENIFERIYSIPSKFKNSENNNLHFGKNL